MSTDAINKKVARLRPVEFSPSAEDPENGDEVAETVIEARAGWQLIDFKELWRYRDLLFFLAWRDVKVRYKQTVLGAAWAILQPTLTMVVFAVFLGRLAQVPTGGIP